MNKTLKDLSNEEIFEDIKYWVDYLQMRSAYFNNNLINHIRNLIVELEERCKLEKDAVNYIKNLTEELKRRNE